MILRGCPTNSIAVTIIFFLYKTGESMLDATTRPYILKAVCHDNFPFNATYCQHIDWYPDIESDIQRKSATYLIYYRILINVPSVILGLFCGAYSDKYGRKIPMMLPSLGSVFGVLLYMASLAYDEFRIPLILIGAAVQGMFGKSTVITMAVNSYIADVTENDERIRKLGNLLAMNFFGLFVGSFMSGILQDISNLLTTYCVVILLHGCTILLTVAAMKESVEYPAKSEEGKSEFLALFNPANIKDAFGVLVKYRPNNMRTVLLVLFLLTLLNQTCKVGEMDVTVLFVTRSPLSWPKSWYGYLLSVDYAVMGLCLLFVLPVLSSIVHLSDASILMIGISCKIVRLTWAAFAFRTWMVYVSVIIGAFAGLITSAVRSLVSKSVNEHEAGKLFSLLACAETASKLFGVLIFVNLYSETADMFAGLAYLFEAVLYICMILLVIWIFKDLKNVGTIDLMQALEEHSNFNKGSVNYNTLSNNPLPVLDELEEQPSYPTPLPATTP